jgi:hypothetical protein
MILQANIQELGYEKKYRLSIEPDCFRIQQTLRSVYIGNDLEHE